MRPKPIRAGSAATPQAARQHLKRVLAKDEPKRRAKPEPLDPAIKAIVMPKAKRPEGYNPALAERILARMWHGEFLHTICRSPGMPWPRTVASWCQSHPEFRRAYAEARYAVADALFSQCLELADDRRGDVNAQGFGVAANVLRARLMVDTRKWLCAKLDPKRYGLDQAIDHGGEVIHRHLIDRPPNETREQWLERRRAELALPAPTPSPSPQDGAGRPSGPSPLPT